MLAAELTPFSAFVLAWLFLLGCAAGSHLNVWIWRLPRGLTVNDPERSICPHCRHVIRWYDNVPLLSFFLLRRRCRDCGGPISWRYPVVEALTGVLFALIYYREGLQAGTAVGQLALMMLVTSLLIVASAVDVEYFIIPDEVSVFGIMGGLLAGVLLPELHVGTQSYNTFERLTGDLTLDGLIGSAIGALGGGGMIFVFALIGAAIFRREALGFGDVKLMAMLGAFFGWKVVVTAFFLSPFLGLIYGLPLMLMSNENVMPYGPFLSLGAVLALVFRTPLCDLLVPLEHMAHMLLT